jgi:di/tricarboxylate transporter
MEIWLVSFILVTAMILFISEKLPLDLTSIGILVALMVTGILTPKETLAAFSHSSVITIGAMFMLSRGLMRTGALGFVSERMIKYSRGNPRRILILSMVATAIPSAFMNNTPVVVLFVTILMSVCCEYGLSPSKYLIPISYSAIVGGTCTLIGTSTNLIVSDLSSRLGYGAIGMFELAPVGVPIMILTMVFLYFAVPRVMPEHKEPVCQLSGKDVPHYLTELRVPPQSRLIGQQAGSFFHHNYPSIELFEVIRGPIIHYPEREEVSLTTGDILLVKGTANDLVGLLKSKMVELPHKHQGINFKAWDDKSLIVELVVTPLSRLLGEQPLRSNLLQGLGIQTIAVKRRGIHYSEQKIGELKLSVGDILLIQCSRDRLDEIRTRPDFIILEDIHHQIMSKRKAPLALIAFTGMIVAATTGYADITAAAITAVFFMLVTGCLQLRDAYRSVDVQVLLVIIGTIALGTAMEKTGADKIYAEAFLAPFQGQNPAVILAGFILLTLLITELMSNSATAVLLLPIAISTAISLGVSPRPFVIGVCIGASYGFAIPAGYQTHMLVYGPGGYRFSDFLKLGIPLDLMAWAAGSIIIPYIWPF